MHLKVGPLILTQDAELLLQAKGFRLEILVSRSMNRNGSNMIDAPDLASPRFKAGPHPFYARLRAEAPVWRTTLPDRRAAWLVTRYDDVARYSRMTRSPRIS